MRNAPNVSLVLDSTSLVGPSINKKKLERIIKKIYIAVVHAKGLYNTIKMETHAPQRIYYPGASSVTPQRNPASTQQNLFSLDHVESEIDSSKEKSIVLEPTTPEHRRWLWFATLTDRREVSTLVYRAHCEIYARYPNFYEPGVEDLDSEWFRKTLKENYKIGSPNQSAGNWQICAATLFGRFDGDPVKLLSFAGWSVESVYAWKQQEKKLNHDPIPGWGRKLISLYFLYLAELGYPLPDDVFASDVHAQALVLQTGCFNFGDKEAIFSTPFAEMVRKAVVEICKEKNFSIVEVGNGQWLLGSALCEQCSKRADAPILCPIYDECGGRVDTSYYWKKGLWPKALPRLNKGGMRPPFGMPTDVTRRLNQRKATVIPILQEPLFAPKALTKKGGQGK
jgi:hypothetical protein